MPRFAYRAKDSTLQVVEGTIEADNETAALSRLGQVGVFPVSISEVGRAVPTARVQPPRRISPRLLAYSTRQLADLLDGGLPLLGALTLLAKQTEQPALARVIESVAAAVRDGRSLSEAMTAHPTVFPPLFCSMVRAGEVGGGLIESLNRLADLAEHEAELRSRIAQAFAYPVFVLGVALVMTVFLMAYVIPRLSLVLIETGQILPLPTRMLLATSEFVTRWWWALVAGLVLAVVTVRQWYHRPAGKLTVDRALIRMPAVGTLVRKLETGRLARNLGTLVGQGVPILQALEVVTASVANATLQRSVTQVLAAVREGSSLAAALTATGQFPAFVGHMVAVGEEAGTADAALVKVAATYEREVDRALRMLTTILEPALLVLVGGVVMFIVLAMLLPVFQLGLGVQ